jgi:DNA polymerase-3 subunit beta
VRLSLAKNSLVVSAEDAEMGSEAKETLKCGYGADSMEIGFNAAYLVDVLSHIDGDEISMMLSSPNKAVIIKPTSQQKGETLMMLIMPVRLNA